MRKAIASVFYFKKKPSELIFLFHKQPRKVSIPRTSFNFALAYKNIGSQTLSQIFSKIIYLVIEQHGSHAMKCTFRFVIFFYLFSDDS